MTALHMLVHTRYHRYAVRHNDIATIQLVDAAPEPTDDHGALIKVDLGALCDPVDQSLLQRRHGLFIPLRRKQIIIMVDRIDALPEPTDVQQLPVLFQQQLKYHWAIGAIQLNDELVIQLDLRAVARSVLLPP